MTFLTTLSIRSVGRACKVRLNGRIIPWDSMEFLSLRNTRINLFIFKIVVCVVIRSYHAFDILYRYRLRIVMTEDFYSIYGKFKNAKISRM